MTDERPAFERVDSGVERRKRLGAFLRSKRAAARPESYQLPVHRRRRVPGLRREELALLVGISVTWYTQFESGAPITVSPAMLRRTADVLGLSALERAYLFSLAIDEMGIVPSVLSDLEILSGGRIVAETFEAEVAMVLRTHRALKSQIYSALLHDTVDELRPNLTEERCPIGYWLHDGLCGDARHSSYYNRAARIHAAFHREIDKVIDESRSGTRLSPERILTSPGRYVAASDALERTFSQWART